MATPLVVNERLVKVDGEKKFDATLYRSFVGNLLYLIATRPDIMFVSSLLSRFMHNPNQLYLGTTKKVLRNIKGKINYDIKYNKGVGAKLIGYCDSN